MEAVACGIATDCEKQVVRIGRCNGKTAQQIGEVLVRRDAADIKQHPASRRQARTPSRCRSRSRIHDRSEVRLDALVEHGDPLRRQMKVFDDLASRRLGHGHES